MFWDILTLAFLCSIPWLLWDSWVGYIFLRIPLAFFQGACAALHRR